MNTPLDLNKLRGRFRAEVPVFGGEVIRHDSEGSETLMQIWLKASYGYLIVAIDDKFYAIKDPHPGRASVDFLLWDYQVFNDEDAAVVAAQIGW